MTDIAPSAAIIITFGFAGFAFAFCVGVLWGAGDMKRRLQTKQDQIEDIAP